MTLSPSAESNDEMESREKVYDGAFISLQDSRTSIYDEFFGADQLKEDNKPTSGTNRSLK